jgi:hypothetical protein
VWNFIPWKNKEANMNPIIFLTSGEDISIKNCDMIFEMVLIFNDGREITCGYGALPLENLNKAGNKAITIEGGNPLNKRQIDGSMIKKTKLESKLHINIRTMKSATKSTQFLLSGFP